ncbi:hypothetical protein [Streptomyces griseus]|uniref:hypothetical protein n=1 Tax=Streptomyces griseus TaxID=1911 RepID=UPI00331DB471
MITYHSIGYYGLFAALSALALLRLIGALTRYVRLLRSTITGLGHPVPAPSPEDAHLIDQ